MRIKKATSSQILLEKPTVDTDLITGLLSNSKSLDKATFTTLSMASCIKKVLEEYPLLPNQKARFHINLQQDFKARLSYFYFKYVLFTLLNAIYQQEKTHKVSIWLTKQQVHIQSAQGGSLSKNRQMVCRHIMHFFDGEISFKLGQEEEPAMEFILRFPSFHGNLGLVLFKRSA